MEDKNPVLVASKPLGPKLKEFKRIPITCNNLTLGRGLNNAVVLPSLNITRTNHCTIKKIDDDWYLEDNSSVGVCINGKKVGKGNKEKLSNEDIVQLEPEELVYKFIDHSDVYETPRKRIKLENIDSEDIINHVKMRFEESQNFEMIHNEAKIQNAKDMQETFTVLKEQTQLDMERKINKIQSECALQIENLKGEKDEVEKQKALLLEERDKQLSGIKDEMESKIKELKDQIQKHHETESELLKENNSLKEKVIKEREEFLEELARESSSKQDMLDKLNAKIREQEEIRLKEKQELEEMLRNETEQLRIAKEQELKELEEEKKRREMELEEELSSMKVNLEQKIQQVEDERLKAEQMLAEKLEEQRKLTDEEKIKGEQLIQEREEIEKKLAEAQKNAEKTIEEVKASVAERETELKALAAERIQQQVEQSTEVITSLQEQLEKVKSQLQSVESENQTLLSSIVGASDRDSPGPSTQRALTAVGELMESELQCSICAELFVTATTLSCSHTFCKYCITMWKKKKKDCPICRQSISSECKSLVLDSFIEKMVQNLTEEMKKKRQEMLKAREELESELARQPSVGTSRGSISFDESDYNSGSELIEEGEEEEYDEEYDDYGSYWAYDPRPGSHDDFSDSDGGSDESDADERAGAPAGHTRGGAGAAGAAGLPDNTERRAAGDGGRRRRGRIEGDPGAYYGGYGRCYSCGARGHWAPGCPFR